MCSHLLCEFASSHNFLVQRVFFEKGLRSVQRSSTVIIVQRSVADLQAFTEPSRDFKSLQADSSMFSIILQQRRAQSSTLHRSAPSVPKILIYNTPVRAACEFCEPLSGEFARFRRLGFWGYGRTGARLERSAEMEHSKQRQYSGPSRTQVS